MRNAETVLAVIRERGRRGLPLNDGAMTCGATQETVDGMSLTKIDRIIADLRQERYRWTPARRIYIPKSNGKQRPLGLPSWSDKLLQEVIRNLLDAYYEP